MNTSDRIKLFFHLFKLQYILTRKFDNSLGGLSMVEFMILLALSEAEDNKLRRTDLAEQIGLTASGVTRILLPMEKIGMVKKQSDSRDARASYVLLASGGKRLLEEGLLRATELSSALLSSHKTSDIVSVIKVLQSLSKEL